MARLDGAGGLESSLTPIHPLIVGKSRVCTRIQHAGDSGYDKGSLDLLFDVLSSPRLTSPRSHPKAESHLMHHRDRGGWVTILRARGIQATGIRLASPLLPGPRHSKSTFPTDTSLLRLVDSDEAPSRHLFRQRLL